MSDASIRAMFGWHSSVSISGGGFPLKQDGPPPSYNAVVSGSPALCSAVVSESPPSYDAVACGDSSAAFDVLPSYELSLIGYLSVVPASIEPPLYAQVIPEGGFSPEARLSSMGSG